MILLPGRAGFFLFGRGHQVLLRAFQDFVDNGVRDTDRGSGAGFLFSQQRLQGIETVDPVHEEFLLLLARQVLLVQESLQALVEGMQQVERLGMGLGPFIGDVTAQRLQALDQDLG